MSSPSPNIQRVFSDGLYEHNYLSEKSLPDTKSCYLLSNKCWWAKDFLMGLKTCHRTKIIFGRQIQPFETHTLVIWWAWCVSFGSSNLHFNDNARMPNRMLSILISCIKSGLSWMHWTNSLISVTIHLKINQLVKAWSNSKAGAYSSNICQWNQQRGVAKCGLDQMTSLHFSVSDLHW